MSLSRMKPKKQAVLQANLIKQGIKALLSRQKTALLLL